MDRLATAAVIAAVALLATGWLGSNAQAKDSPVTAPAIAPALTQVAPVQRSGRILGLLLTLDALRRSPSLLDPPKG